MLLLSDRVKLISKKTSGDAVKYLSQGGVNISLSTVWKRKKCRKKNGIGKKYKAWIVDEGRFFFLIKANVS